ncbi:MAG: hypothetical protein ABFS56_11005 [Pseudomonadota bacterium]
MALQNLKTLMVDYETPIEIRLEIAFKLFEIFGTESRAPSEEILAQGIEKNAHIIDGNAHRLSHIESLLELVSQHNNQATFQHGTFSPKRIINH